MREDSLREHGPAGGIAERLDRAGIRLAAKKSLMVPLEQLSVFRANISLRKLRQIADRPPSDFDFSSPSGCGETERSILRAFLRHC